MTLCGLEEAGKTSIKVYLENLDKNEALKPYIASNEVEIYKRHHLTIFVIPGQERYRYVEFYYQQYFTPSSIIGLVVDASDIGKFDEVAAYWGFLKEMIDKYAKSRNVVLIAHKQDKKNALPAEKIARKIFSKGDIKKYNIRMIDTSILDIFSMYSLLRMFYGDLSKVGLDLIVQTLAFQTRAAASFLIDGHMLPLSVVGSKDALSFMEEIFYPIYKRGRLHYLILKFEGIRFLAVSKGGESDYVVVGVYDYKVPMGEAIKLCEKALDKYFSEARKRWKSLG